MLPTYFLQQWFNLLDSAAEGALYNSALRQFDGVDMGTKPLPTIPRSTSSDTCYSLVATQLFRR